MTIDRWVTDAARRTPDKIALEFGSQEKISYSRFAELIDQVVSAFVHAGVKHGDRIAWYGLNHPDVFVLLFACARLGAIFVPLNWRLAEPEIAAVVANCDPHWVVHDEHFSECAQALLNVQVLSHSVLYSEPSSSIERLAG